MNNRISVLSTLRVAEVLVKRYWLDNDGVIQSSSYSNSREFRQQEASVNNIRDFYSLLQKMHLARRYAIIRGHPNPQTQEITERKSANFPEAPDGTPWVMLDIDGVPAPEWVGVCSLEAVEHVIQLLPPEFQAATCVYMFSNSAGIRKPDGSLLKEGIRVHLFYFLDQPIRGGMMAAYLENWCYESGFYNVGLNKGRVTMVTHGIDMAPIKSSVQLHYTAAPIIAPEITVDISPEERLGIIEGTVESVVIPEIPAGLPDVVGEIRRTIRNNWAIENGFLKKTQRVQLQNGARTYETLIGSEAATSTGRVLARSTLRSDDRILQLFFQEEKTPGSWYVTKRRPWMGVRYGDEMEIPLEELCPQALEKVQELGWIASMPEVITEEELANLPESTLQGTGSGSAQPGTLEFTQNQIFMNAHLPYTFRDGHVCRVVATKEGARHDKLISYTYVYGHLRDMNEHNWSYILHVLNREGRFSEIVVPATAFFDHADFRQQLLRCGATIDACTEKKHLINYIQHYPVQRYFLTVDKLGWAFEKKYFLLPGCVISKTGEENVEEPYLAHEAQSHVVAIKQSGTLQEWQEMVAEPCSGNSLLELMLYLGFVAPLLEPLDLPNIGVHLYGETSRGKTTALRVTASIYGNPQGMVQNWRTTDNAMESLAYFHNNITLLLDEINQVTPKMLAEIIYMLGNGGGKNRARQDSSLRAAKRWHLAYLSSGEVRTDEYMREEGTRRVMGGQAVRMLDISVDAGREMGVVEELRHFNTSGALIEHLNQATATFHGTPIVHFIQRLMDTADWDDLRRSYQETKSQFLTEIGMTERSSQLERILGHFASIAFAGELAIRLGTLPFQAGQAMASVVRVAQRYIQNREGMEGSDILEAINRMRRLLSLHRYSHFQQCSDNDGRIQLESYHTPNPFWGYYVTKLDRPGYYYIPVRIFKEVFCVGVSHKEVLKALQRRGWIDSLAAQNFGPDRKRCYKISETFVDEHDNGSGVREHLFEDPFSVDD